MPETDYCYFLANGKSLSQCIEFLDQVEAHRKGAMELNSGKIFMVDGDKPQKVSEEPKGDSTQLAVDDFFRCIREGDKPIANSEAGRKAALVGLLGRTAIYEGRVVTMKEILAQG